MPPKSSKSKEAPAERPILGRFSSHLKIGIVGLPNVGKSTLFNTLTKLAIPAENFPFCTIEPNEARVNIPDERFEWLCQLYKPKSEVFPRPLTSLALNGSIKYQAYVSDLCFLDLSRSLKV
uniref:OBG-type G domain-containing protein n=1 Tax=Vitis vinifera TaxID=29760 RepID=A5B4W7_VITVI|nr:hypothetical protein VITISV_035841 [Vitis vinifera]